MVAAGILLSTGVPVGAATVLQNPSATPTSGTTATTFVLSVEYVSDPEARPALSATVEVVGLGGSPLPMSLVAGDAINGTWETSTMLPAGSWELVFRADASGSDPTPAAGPTVTVIDAATPTPAPSSTSTAAPTATVPPQPTPTVRPTAVPTPPPPGVTPAATPTPASVPAPPGASAPAPSAGSTASAAELPSHVTSARPSTSAGPGPTGAPSGSPAPTPSPDRAASGESGWGRAGWIVLGGLTSAAGAAVLARQWLVRRATTDP